MSLNIQSTLNLLSSFKNIDASKKDVSSVGNDNSSVTNVKTDTNSVVRNDAASVSGESLTYNNLSSSLARASAVSDVALAAGNMVSDIFGQMQEKANLASNSSISDDKRSSLNSDFSQLRDQASDIINNTSYDGVNLLSGNDTYSFPISSDGSQSVNISSLNLSFDNSSNTQIESPPSQVYISNNDNLNTADSASQAASNVSASIEYLNNGLSNLSDTSNRIDSHSNFINRLQNVSAKNVDNMVDKDLSVEGAKLKSLQVKQDLSTQSSSISNQGSQDLLKLFQ